MLRAWFEAYLRRRYAWLLAALLAAVGIDPVLELMGLRGRTLDWLLALGLVMAVAGVWRARGSRFLVYSSSATLVAWLMLHVVRFGLGPSLAPAVLGAGGLVMSAWILSGVLAEGRVDAERICAALCVYFLVGLAFGGFFATLESLAPGSLAGTGLVAGRGILDFDEAVYFSFVTLATLGYGDLVPTTEAARALSILEAVFGQLYLAVLVARLVSLYSRER